MSLLAAILLAFYFCCTASFGLPQGETMEVVYIPARNSRRSPETIETTSHRNPYHPLVRFRTMEVRPAYFYVLDKFPESDELKLTTRELAELLSSVYEEEYHEPLPKKYSNMISFGVMR